MSNRLVLGYLAAAMALVLASCGSTDLVAPDTATITLDANPLTIPADGGTSSLHVTVAKSSGYPTGDGTVVTFTTTLGSITPQAETRSGVATGVLTGTGTVGDATVTARSGNLVSESVTVQIGESPTDITLTATPASLPIGGGTSQLTAVVFGSGGTPRAGVSVTFSTTAGSLASGGSTLTTNAQGEVFDTLTTIATATVTANTTSGGESGGSLPAEITVEVETTSVAQMVLSATPTILPLSGGTSSLVAVVFGDDGLPVAGAAVAFSTTAGSLSEQGVILTDEAGEARNTLTTTANATVTATSGSHNATATVTVEGDPVVVRLSASRNSITDTTTDPGPAFCDASANPQVPIKLVAQVTDSLGRPQVGRSVIFFIELALIDECARAFGEFCGSGTTAVTGVTDASGEATAELGLSDDDFALCRSYEGGTVECGSTGSRYLFCQTAVTAESGTTVDDTFKSVIIEWAR